MTSTSSSSSITGVGAAGGSVLLATAGADHGVLAPPGAGPDENVSTLSGVIFMLTTGVVDTLGVDVLAIFGTGGSVLDVCFAVVQPYRLW